MQMTRLTCQYLGIIALGMGTWVPGATAQPCATDAECAPPTACRSGRSTCTQSGGSSDGGFTMSDPVCVADPPTCTWVLAACQSDAECTLPSWDCMSLNGAVPPTSICFPKAIPCTLGTTCPAGWSCVDFATVEEQDMREMWPASGSTRFCWPDVVAGVPHKTMEVDSSGLGLTGVTGGGSEGTSLGAADGGTTGRGGSIALPGSDASVPVASADGSSGCSMSGRDRAAGLWLPLTLALAFLLGRRRP